jgi:flagellar basal-body rod modification protein FlgD
MSSPVGNIGTTNGVDKPSTTTTTTSSTSTTTDDKDMFLKLLIAQMKYQDPSNPTDSTQYISQMAQFTQVQTMETMADQQASLLTTNQLQSAVSMVGKSVYYGAGDSASSGVVSGVVVEDGVPELLIGKDRVALTAVTGVNAAPTAGSSSGTSS